MISSTLDIILFILAGLVAGLAGAIAVLIFVDVMFRIAGSSLFEVIREIEELEEEIKKYKDDD